MLKTVQCTQGGNFEIGQKPTSFQNSHNLLKLQASDCWLFWCFVVSHGLMRDSNPKSRNFKLNTQGRGPSGSTKTPIQAVPFKTSDFGFEMGFCPTSNSPAFSQCSFRIALYIASSMSAST